MSEYPSSSKMKFCCPVVLICVGVFSILGAIIYIVGFNFIVKTAIPIAMNGFPLNEKMHVWLTVPLDLAITATLTNATASSNELTNRTLGRGQLNVNVEMAQEEGEADKVFPIIWFEEDGSIDELIRYMMVFSSGPLNYAKYFCGSIAVLLFIFAIIVTLLWI